MTTGTMTPCDHPPNAILANKFNQVVQCHRCGHVFEWLDDDLETWQMEPDAFRSDTQ